MRPNAVLFDLDNTLTDRPRSITGYAGAFLTHFTDRLDESEPDVLIQKIVDADRTGDRPRSEFFAGLLESLPWHNLPDISELEDHYYSNFPQCSEPMTGMWETLNVLRSRKVRMGIVTNGPDAIQNAKVEALALWPYMGAVIISSAVGLSKPDERIFRVALAALEVKPNEAWFVGDNPMSDILGASTAGLTPVWIRSTHTWPQEHRQPRYQIDSLDELIPLIYRQDQDG